MQGLWLLFIAIIFVAVLCIALGISAHYSHKADEQVRQWEKEHYKLQGYWQ